MAIDALSIPFDITWQRIGFMSDMVERGFESATLPPKWRSSATIYGYVVPLAETEEAYPDHRIVYLKVSASVTGWSPRETMATYLRILDDGPWSPDGNEGPPDGGSGPGDSWDDEAQGTIGGSHALTRTYWPCVAAVLQVAVYPRPEQGVADDDYPYIADFEPKKRELYETVTSTNEALSGSQSNTNIRKGTTSTHSGEVSMSTAVSLPLVGESGISARYGYRRENVDITTTDNSTERRETAGSSTQLAQMYQLWNGYHVGTNRAVFAMFPRPHIVSDSDQTENSLITGERKLEGVQDVFLIVQMPRTNPGMCVRVLLDLSHKTDGTVRDDAIYTSTRRRVSGCATFADDRLVPVRGATPVNVPRVEVIDEGQVTGWVASDPAQLKTGRPARVAIADDLNLASAQLQRTVLGTAASGAYRPRPFVQSATFRQLAARQLTNTKLPLADLEQLGYLQTGERAELETLEIATSGGVFTNAKDGSVAAVVEKVRARLLDAVVARAKAVVGDK